jgi:hypothetical protein
MLEGPKAALDINNTKLTKLNTAGSSGRVP